MSEERCCAPVTEVYIGPGHTLTQEDMMSEKHKVRGGFIAALLVAILFLGISQLSTWDSQIHDRYSERIRSERNLNRRAKEARERIRLRNAITDALESMDCGCPSPEGA